MVRGVFLAIKAECLGYVVLKWHDSGGTGIGVAWTVAAAIENDEQVDLNLNLRQASSYPKFHLRAEACIRSAAPPDECEWQGQQ